MESGGEMDDIPEEVICLVASTPCVRVESREGSIPGIEDQRRELSTPIPPLGQDDESISSAPITFVASPQTGGIAEIDKDDIYADSSLIESPSTKKGKKRKAKEPGSVERKPKKAKKKKKKHEESENDAKAGADVAENGVTTAESSFQSTPPAKEKRKRVKKKKENSPKVDAKEPEKKPAAAAFTPKSADEICVGFGLQNIEYEYTEEDYANLTTYKLFGNHMKPLISKANPKVLMSKIVMLVGAKWREFVNSNPNKEPAPPVPVSTPKVASTTPKTPRSKSKKKKVPTATLR